MSLENKIEFCYIAEEDLFSYLDINELNKENFLELRENWKKIINKEANFFSDTELFLTHKNFLILFCQDENHELFLAKTYQLEYQNICQKIFQEKKDIIIINKKKKNEEKDKKKFIILFKDEETIKKFINEGLKKILNIN